MQDRIIPYNPVLKELASALRKNMTHAEALLWTMLNRKQMCGYDFGRQRPLDEYIVDFYCKELRLAIEIDGGSHAFKEARDIARQKRLESLGVRFLRFTEREVVAGLQSVADQIEMWIEQQTGQQPTPAPPRRGTGRDGTERATDPSGRREREQTRRKPTPGPSKEGNGRRQGGNPPLPLQGGEQIA